MARFEDYLKLVAEGLGTVVRGKGFPVLGLGDGEVNIQLSSRNSESSSGGTERKAEIWREREREGE